MKKKSRKYDLDFTIAFVLRFPTYDIHGNKHNWSKKEQVMFCEDYFKYKRP